MFMRSFRGVPRKYLIAAALLTSAALPAQADGYKWTGISVYAGGGGTILDGDVGLKDTTEYGAGIECQPMNDVPHDFEIPIIGCKELGPLTKDISNRLGAALNGDPGIFGTVGVGADYEVMPRFVIGAFADIDWSNADATFSGKTKDSEKIIGPLKVTGTTELNGKLEYDYSWTIGGRLGFVSENRRALLYVLGGYTQLHTDGFAQINNSVDLSLGHSFFHDIGIGFDAGPIRVGLPKTFEGGTIGVGGEVKLTNVVSLKLEGRYTNLQAKSVSYSADQQGPSKDLAVFDKACSGATQTLVIVDKDCKAVLVTTADSKGNIDIDPEIWSGRVALSFKLD